MAAKYRLYPTAQQEPFMFECCNHSRLIWNIALEHQKMSRFFHCRSDWNLWDKYVTEMRREKEFKWLTNVPVSVQQQALRQLRQALMNYYNNPAHFGYPQFRSKYRTTPGFVIRDTKIKINNRKWASVWVQKLGWVKFRLSRPLPDKIGMGNVTIDKTGCWFVSFNSPQPEVAHTDGWEDNHVGIDLGCSSDSNGFRNTIVVSDGTISGIPKATAEEEKHLRFLQKRLARQDKGSKRWRRTKKLIAKAYKKFANRRKDWVEKTSTMLVANNALVVFEDLKVKNMMKSSSGTIDNPGKNVAAKSALNKLIAESCWGMLVRRVETKGKASGTEVVLVLAHYTSQTCSSCGYVSASNRRDRDTFVCLECGHEDDADLNAAHNILAAGLAVTGRGRRAQLSVEASTTSCLTAREETLSK